MQRLIFGAAILLVIQIGLAITLISNKRTLEAFTPLAKLVEFSPETINRLTIEGDGKTLEIKKQGSVWILPDTFSVPADTIQVLTLLDKLAGLSQGLAVATSKEAARRFRVSEDAFERHLILKNNDKIITDLYVGSSPGLKKVYVRRSDRDEIFTVALSTFELETTSNKWIDKSLAQVKEKTIKNVKFAKYSLTKQGDGWQLDALATGQQTNAKEVQSLVDKVSGLVIRDVVDGKEIAELFDKDPVFQYTLMLDDGTSIVYVFVKPETGNYVLKRSDQNFFLEIDSLAVDNLKDFSREKLITEAVQENTEKVSIE